MDIKYIFILIQFVIIVFLVAINDANLTINEHHCTTEQVKDYPHSISREWW